MKNILIIGAQGKLGTSLLKKYTENSCEMLEATKTGIFVGNYFLKTDLQRKFYELITNHHELIPIFISKSYSEKHMLEIK